MTKHMNLLASLSRKWSSHTPLSFFAAAGPYKSQKKCGGGVGGGDGDGHGGDFFLEWQIPPYELQ